MTETVKIKLTGSQWAGWLSKSVTNDFGLTRGSVVDATPMDDYGWYVRRVGGAYIGCIYSEPNHMFAGELVPYPVAVEENLVDHPSHYTKASIEVIDVIEAFDLDKDGYRKDAVKYILRAPHKGNPQQDIKKAIWYLERWLTRNPEEVAA